MAAGREVYTVEALAADGELSDAQRAMAAGGGSQCGYCTPGFVVSLFAEQYRSDRTGRCDTMALAGNLCRCTGYRPIRDAAHSLGPAPDDQFRGAWASPRRAWTKSRCPVFASGDRRRMPLALARSSGCEDRRGRDRSRSGIQPVLAPLAASDQPRRDRRASRVFEHGQRRQDWRGAAAQRDRPTVDRRADSVQRMADVLRLAAHSQPRDARRQPRHRVSHRRCGAAAAGARRRRSSRGAVEVAETIPLSAFFTAYRKTACVAGEIITAIEIPKPLPQFVRFYKVAKRRLDDISTVAAAMSLDLRCQAARAPGAICVWRSRGRRRSGSIEAEDGDRRSSLERRGRRAGPEAILDRALAADERSSRLEGIPPRGIEEPGRQSTSGSTRQ